MTSKEYYGLLLDRKWKRKRDQILNRDKWKCTVCGSRKELEVHHTYYIYGHAPWEYPNNSLITVCHTCHRDWHEHHELVVKKDKPAKDKRLKKKPKRKDDKKRVKSLIRGMRSDKAESIEREHQFLYKSPSPSKAI